LPELTTRFRRLATDNWQLAARGALKSSLYHGPRRGNITAALAKETDLADDPVESTLGPANISPRLPPVGEREGGGGGRGRERRAKPSTRALRRDAGEARRELQAEIDHGNALLAKGGHGVRLELIAGSGNLPDRIAVCYPAAGGVGEQCVTRTIRRWELQQWLARLERLGGLLVDTER
jgi:hypothetical protein